MPVYIFARLPRRVRIAAAALSALCLSACATLPADSVFPAVRPAGLDPANGPIAVVGDLQMTPLPIRALLGRENNRDEQRLLLGDLERRADNVSALVIVGDLVFAGWSRQDWRHFDEAVSPLVARLPTLPVMGNHDYRCILVKFCSQGKVPRGMLERFPWISPGEPSWLPYGDIALVFLDSETELEAQGQWLGRQLASFEGRFSAVVVFTHRPPYTENGAIDVYPDTDVQAHFVSALRESSLTSVFMSGHAHGYEHLVVDGMHFIVTAGGGGPRGKLVPELVQNVYTGPECRRDRNGRVLRPYNYALVESAGEAIEITVRGFCRGDEAVRTIDSFSIPVSRP